MFDIVHRLDVAGQIAADEYQIDSFVRPDAAESIFRREETSVAHGACLNRFHRRHPAISTNSSEVVVVSVNFTVAGLGGYGARVVPTVETFF